MSRASGSPPRWRRLLPLAVTAVVGLVVGVGGTFGAGALPPGPDSPDRVPEQAGRRTRSS